MDSPGLGLECDRSSGVLLHPTSLPGGHIGSAALRFIDWLADAGQHWWQVLPLGPPDAYGSPYASESAFAGSPALLDRPHARVTPSQLEDFVEAHSYWAADWARYRGKGALEDQVRFDREWSRVRRHAAERDIRILGDMPFYVASHGADHLIHRDLFDDDEIAGVPPDVWSTTGQLWGNPTYDWAAMRDDGYRWWIERFRRTREQFDAIRLDHFRGFVAYWSVTDGSPTAEHGRWRRSPGRQLFDILASKLGEWALVAENLGVITPAVERLRHDLKIPGTIVLQFEFFTPVTVRQRHDDATEEVVYTGTHDNDTSLHWWHTASERERKNLERSLFLAGIQENEPHWKLIRLALHHQAKLCILAAQDILGLDGSARMNRPGQSEGNWRWQLAPGMLSKTLASRLHDATAAASR